MDRLFLNQRIKHILLINGIVLFSWIFVTIFLGVVLKVSPLLLAKTFIEKGYSLHHNLIRPPFAYSISFNLYIYCIFLFSIFISILIYKFVAKNLKISPQQVMFYVSCILFVIVTLNQLFNFHFYYKFERNLFSGKSLQEKNLRLNYGLAYTYSSFCHHYIKGYQNAQLITDVNINKDPGMLDHRMIAYYLYPIDIRNVRKKQPDYILFYMKNEAREHVPDEFEIIAEINDENLIAKRK